MHPEGRHFHIVDVDLDDLLGILIPGRDRDAVATRSQLLCPAARHEGILNRERVARHQCTAEGWDRDTGSLPPRHETPKDCNPDIMEDARAQSPAECLASTSMSRLRSAPPGRRAKPKPKEVPHANRSNVEQESFPTGLRPTVWAQQAEPACPKDHSTQTDQCYCEAYGDVWSRSAP